MYIQINKEGLTRYKRKHLFPNESGWSVEDYWGATDYNVLTRGTYIKYSAYKSPVAYLGGDKLSILCYCPSCGLRFYGSWYYESFVAAGPPHSHSPGRETPSYLKKLKMTIYDVSRLAREETKAYEPTKEKIDREVQEFRSMCHCPLCGGEIRKVERNVDLVNDESFARLIENPPEAATFPVERSICTAENSATSTSFNIDTAKITGNPVFLQKYVKHLVDAEITIQLLQRRLQELRSLADHYKDCSTKEQMEKMSKVASAEYRRIDGLKNLPSKPVFVEKEPTEPTFVEVGFFNKKKALATNESLQADYEANCRRYRDKKDAYYRELEAWEFACERIKKSEYCTFSEGLEEKKLEILHQLPDYALYQETLGEIRKTEELLTQSYGCLKSLYSCGVIYEKYRDPVALASFYDYLASGRCTTLTGPDGAYNLYESELRLDMIITKLDVIIRNLEQIKSNQYMLYNVMKSMNADLAELNRTTATMKESVESIQGSVTSIDNHSAVIAHNTAVTALYAKKTFELTNAMDFMIALN